TRLRANQKPPVIRADPDQTRAVRTRRPGPTIQITPSVRSANGASRFSLVPSASPPARPARAIAAWVIAGRSAAPVEKKPRNLDGGRSASDPGAPPTIGRAEAAPARAWE